MRWDLCAISIRRAGTDRLQARSADWDAGGRRIAAGLAIQSLDGSALNFGVVLDRSWTGKATIRGCNRQQVRVEISSSPIVDREKGCTTGVLGVMRRAADSSASPGNGPDPDFDCGIVILD